MYKLANHQEVTVDTTHSYLRTHTKMILNAASLAVLVTIIAAVFYESYHITKNAYIVEWSEKDVIRDVKGLDISERRYYYAHGHYDDQPGRFGFTEFPAKIPQMAKHPIYTLTVKFGPKINTLRVVARPIRQEYSRGIIVDNAYGHIHYYHGQ